MTLVFRTVAVAAFATLSVFYLWFGFTYATVNDFLFFHAAAMPEAIRHDAKPLYLALMTLIGAASMALGGLGGFVTLTRIRLGDRLAGLAVALAFALGFGLAAVTAERLADATGAPTTWHLMGILLAIDAVALIAALLSPARKLT